MDNESLREAVRGKYVQGIAKLAGKTISPAIIGKPVVDLGPYERDSFAFTPDLGLGEATDDITPKNEGEV